MGPNLGVLLFSLIETGVSAAGIILWLSGQKLEAYIVWIVGFTLEHVVAYNVSKGRPYFQFPLKP